MEIEKGKTAKYLKEKRPVDKAVTENLRSFTRIKKKVLTSLKEGEKTIPVLAKELDMPAHELMYYLMSLLKYGVIETGEIDDMDEYFNYKIKGE